jgi:hypothetical protein
MNKHLETTIKEGVAILLGILGFLAIGYGVYAGSEKQEGMKSQLSQAEQLLGNK